MLSYSLSYFTLTQLPLSHQQAPFLLKTLSWCVTCITQIWLNNFFFSVSFVYHLNYKFPKCLESTSLVMDATTNNNLVVSLKALYKAEIQNITKLVNIKPGKRNQKLTSEDH